MTGSWKANSHSHTYYCDGKGSVDDVVRAALDAGLDRIGITSHAPLPFAMPWSIDFSRLDEYIRDVREAQERYRDRIRVFLGAELDFLPDEEVRAFQEEKLFIREFDYFVGSVHFLGSSVTPRTLNDTESQFQEILREDYGGDIRAMVEDYYHRVRSMLNTPKLRIVGHLDHIKRWNNAQKYFREDEAWYVEAVEETLREIAASGVTVELNTSGWRKGLKEPFPSLWVLRRCSELAIPVTINSDSHKPEDVALYFDRAEVSLAEIGVRPSDPLAAGTVASARK